MADLIDREAVRGLVEDYWRSFLAVARSSPEVGMKSAAKFNECIEIMTGMMPEVQRGMFLKTVEEIRQELFNEYLKNPIAQKRRLGLPVDTAHRVSYRNQGAGEFVVKTAVRATIWEAILALFRLSQ